MRFLFIPLAIFLTSCTSLNVSNVDWEWEPLVTGCQDKALSWLALPNDSNMSLASIRFGIEPDTGKGPTSFVTIDSGTLMLGNKREPVLIAAYGDHQKSCVVKMPLSDCKEAKQVMDDFSEAKIPVTYAFDKPIGIRVFHGNTYYLTVNDGHNNLNTWSFYGHSHPMIDLIEQSTKKLESCTIDALQMYNGL